MVEKFPPHYLDKSDAWARRVTQRLSEAIDAVASLESRFTAANQGQAAAIAGLWQQVSQLNNASESLSDRAVATAGSPAATSARTNADVVTVQFEAPAWATQGTIIATATFSGADSATAGFNCTFSCSINDTAYGATSIQVPNVLEIRLGGVLQSEQAFDINPAPTTITAAQTFDVSTLSTGYAIVGARLTKPITGANSAFATSVSASVFWSSP